MFFTSKSDLSPQEFKDQLEATEGTVIDCRTAGECAGGTWPGAQQLDWLKGEVHEALDGLDKSSTYFLYCRSGVRSAQAAHFMKASGFSNVHNVGGYNDISDLAE
ncbi:MAG: rhodanese [Crocinitomicaceae bacterium]|nr:rhodanese [Crocinitomicaceae bacterium]